MKKKEIPLTYSEQLLLDGGMICLPEGVSLEEVIKKPLDVIYITRKQTERGKEGVTNYKEKK